MKRSLIVEVRPALNLVSSIILWFSLSFILPAGVALWYGENVLPFLIPAALSSAFGWMGIMFTRTPTQLGVREGFLVVSLAWLAIAAFGALPYLFDHHSLIDAYFESMSGFTTTGATVLTDLEHEPRSILMWRQFTQWLGGMGIVVLAIAVLPKLAVGGRQLMETEAPGPKVDKLKPHLYQTARALWKVYVGLTLLEVVLLELSGMSLFDSVSHAFTTVSSGGFSPHSLSIAEFDPTVQWIIIVFMVLAGTNFALLFRAATGKFQAIRRDSEFRFYLLLLAGAGLVLALLLQKGSFEEQLRTGLFQAISIITTTGFASVDFNQWDDLLKFMLLMLMFFGGCAGSTGGSMKVVRSMLSFKFILREIRKAVHPSAVIPIRLRRRVISEDALSGIMAFSVLYVTTFIIGSALFLLDAYLEGNPVTVLEGVSIVASSLGNVGPAFGVAGPMASYADLSILSKELLIVLMWAGRLELFPVIVLMTRSYWKR